MSNTYRHSRAIEKSLIDEIENILEENNWDNVNVEKTFSRIYNQELPIVCVRAGETSHVWNEIGNTSTRREVLCFIDVFGKSEGDMLDIIDTLLSIKSGCTYYSYTIDNGEITEKTAIGRISVLEIRHELVNFNVDNMADLDIHDRHRGLITLTISINKVE